eukprot:12103527-Alexandrium_andersonii.AAC.1
MPEREVEGPPIGPGAAAARPTEQGSTGGAVAGGGAGAAAPGTVAGAVREVSFRVTLWLDAVPQSEWPSLRGNPSAFLLQALPGEARKQIARLDTQWTPQRTGGPRSRVSSLQAFVVVREPGVAQLIAAGGLGGFFFRRVANQAGAASPACDPPVRW